MVILLPTKTANKVYLIIEALFFNCFIPKELQTDNVTIFRNNKISSFCTKFKKKRNFVKLYYPESQFQAKRFNVMLRCMIFLVMRTQNSFRWCDMLKNIL